jgi:7-carboxy-7-deazaguanine synthase
MSASQTLPIVEIFGPVLQGEGRMIGVQTHFVRLGYCDFRCSWCLGPNTYVTLATGRRKKISEIQVGDVLVGFDEVSGALRPTSVTRVVSHLSDDLWSFGVGTRTVSKRVVATAEHLWMTKRGWVSTCELVPGDVIATGHDYAIAAWRMAYSNPMATPEVVARVSTTQKVLWTLEKRDRQREVQKLISSHREKLLGERNPMKNPDIVAKQVATRIDWKPSSIERRVERLVREAGLPYALCLMSTRVGRRYPDFVIPGTNKAVEVYHPTYFKREANGYAQHVKEDYAAEGWEVLPLAVQPGISDADLVRALTMFALNGLRVHYVHELPRKAHGAMRGQMSVYDITCEPYSTFFANGLLTHNCDTLYAVLPEQVRELSTQMTPEQIAERLRELNPHTPWVTLSGGNPVMHDLSALVRLLHADGRKIAVETQGTIFREWLRECEVVTVSPKPPSSAMETSFEQLDRFAALPQATLKIVVFDAADFAYARRIHQRYPAVPCYLQVGNAVGQDDTAALLRKLDALAQQALGDPTMADVVVLPQLHVLLYGNRRGV